MHIIEKLGGQTTGSSKLVIELAEYCRKCGNKVNSKRCNTCNKTLKAKEIAIGYICSECDCTVGISHAGCVCIGCLKVNLYR